MTRRTLILGLLMLLGWSGVARGEDSTEVRWKFAVRVAGAWDIVQGSDESILHSGIGYNLQLMVPISGSFAIIGNYGRSGQKMDELPQYRDSSFTTYASDLEISSYRYSAGIRYNTKSFFGWRRLRFVMDLSAGKLHHDSNGRALLEDSNGRAGYIWRPTWHDPDWLVEWETGLQFRMRPNVAMEFAVRRFFSIWDLSGSGMSNSTMNQDFGFCFGVTVGVGKKG